MSPARYRFQNTQAWVNLFSPQLERRWKIITITRLLSMRGFKYVHWLSSLMLMHRFIFFFRVTAASIWVFPLLRLENHSLSHLCSNWIDPQSFHWSPGHRWIWNCAGVWKRQTNYGSDSFFSWQDFGIFRRIRSSSSASTTPTRNSKRSSITSCSFGNKVSTWTREFNGCRRTLPSTCNQL